MKGSQGHLSGHCPTPPPDWQPDEDKDGTVLLPPSAKTGTQGKVGAQ